MCARKDPAEHSLGGANKVSVARMGLFPAALPPEEAHGNEACQHGGQPPPWYRRSNAQRGLFGNRFGEFFRRRLDNWMNYVLSNRLDSRLSDLTD